MFYQSKSSTTHKKAYFLFLQASLVCIFLMLSFARGQSVWLESGLAYRENATGSYEPLFKVGLRGFFPLSEPLSLYGALAWRDGLVADVGVWYAFDPNLQDPFGFQTYGGAGLTFVSGDSEVGSEDSFGLALSVAASYAIDETFGVAVTYTHRPLLLPELSQAFDVSLGLTISLDSLLGGSGESISPDVDTTTSDDVNSGAADSGAAASDAAANGAADSGSVQPLTAEPADVLDETAGDDSVDDDLADSASDIQEESLEENPFNEDAPDDSDDTPDAEQP